MCFCFLGVSLLSAPSFPLLNSTKNCPLLHLTALNLFTMCDNMCFSPVFKMFVFMPGDLVMKRLMLDLLLPFEPDLANDLGVSQLSLM